MLAHAQCRSPCGCAEGTAGFKERAGPGRGAFRCRRHVPVRCSAGRSRALGKGAVAGCGSGGVAGRPRGVGGRGQGLGAALAGESGKAWPRGWSAQCEGCGSVLSLCSPCGLEGFARVCPVMWLPVSTRAGAVHSIRDAGVICTTVICGFKSAFWSLTTAGSELFSCLMLAGEPELESKREMGACCEVPVRLHGTSTHLQGVIV